MAWNRPSEDAAGHRVNVDVTSPSRHWWYVVGAVVVLGAAVAAWWLWPTGETRQDAASKKRGLIKEVTPAVAPKAEEAKPKEKDPHEGFVLSSQGVWQPKGRPYRPSWKKVHGVVTNDVGRNRQTAASNSIEQVMLQIFSRSLGDMPLPFPSYLPQQDMDRLVEILIDKNPIDENDSEQIKCEKEILQFAKSEMMKYIKEGGDPQDFLKDYHDQLYSAYFKRFDAQNFLMEAIRKNESPEIIDGILRKYNKRLEAEGIKPISIPEEFYKTREQIESEARHADDSNNSTGDNDD